MEISIAVQTLVFLKAILLGTALSVLYDVLRAVRRVAHAGVGATAVCDALFWIILLPALFIFVLTVANGEGRGYILLGMGLGAVLYFLTLSPPLLIFFCWIDKLIYTLIRILHKLYGYIRIFGRRCKKHILTGKNLKENFKKLFHFHIK